MEHYLRTVTQALNQHAVVLNKLSNENDVFVRKVELTNVLDKIEGAISIYDNQFLEKLEIQGRILT